MNPQFPGYPQAPVPQYAYPQGQPPPQMGNQYPQGYSVPQYGAPMGQPTPGWAPTPPPVVYSPQPNPMYTANPQQHYTHQPVRCFGRRSLFFAGLQADVSVKHFVRLKFG